MNALLIAGSPTSPSRSAALLEAAGRSLLRRNLRAEWLRVRELPADALLHGRRDDPALREALDRVAQAGVVVFATPIYKAAYSAMLKALIDLLPQDGLAGKWVWSLATGGSAVHTLAIDHALRPVLDNLGARRVLPTVFATDAQIALDGEPAPEISRRLDAIAGDLAYALEGEAELRRLAQQRSADAARCRATA